MSQKLFSRLQIAIRDPDKVYDVVLKKVKKHLFMEILLLFSAGTKDQSAHADT
jgi:hypothetical protein